MKKLLITGSVLNSNMESVQVYKKLVELCEQKGYKVSSPLDTMKFTGNDQEKYQRAMNLVNTADIIIAEISTPSTGQGMELQQAVINNIPILLIAKNNSKISGMIKGYKNIVDILFYNTIDDICNDILKKL